MKPGMKEAGMNAPRMRAASPTRCSRRAFLGMTSFAALAAGAAWAQDAPAPRPALADLLQPVEGGGAADFAAVAEMARRRAQRDHRAVAAVAEGIFADLDYDSYRAIRPAPMALGDGRGAIEVDFLPPGLIFDRPVELAVVRDGQVYGVNFDPSVFDFDPSHFTPEQAAAARRAGPQGMGYSGIRLRSTLNRPDKLDEVAVFQGASYLRAVGRDMLYGLSARGLAIDTAEPAGEEFPAFTRYWIERPDPEAKEIVIRALLESRSCTGAYEFVVAPGDATSMAVRCRLFPRRPLAKVGIAPLTSMYYFGPGDRRGIDDFRDAVHDSDGLQMITGAGRRLWRPLTNPANLQISAFLDDSPQGFGLTQRARGFDDYEDAEARYDRRPSAWIEPAADWGRGQVVLIEIPVESEFHDNIVAFWRPETPLEPREEGHEFTYRILWCATPPDGSDLGRVISTRTGASVNGAGRRTMVVDFEKESAWAEGLKPEVHAGGEKVTGAVLRPLPGRAGMRLAFDFTPPEGRALEFEATLIGPDGPQTETWLHRWTA